MKTDRYDIVYSEIRATINAGVGWIIKRNLGADRAR